MVQVLIKRMNKNAVIPTYGTNGAVGFDFYAVEDMVLEDNIPYKIKLGIAMKVPEGYGLFIVPRSSIGVKTRLIMPNSIGVIDTDYTGEICAIYRQINGMRKHTIKKGERIAQGFIIPVPKVKFVEVDELPKTERGSGGFGSTGK